MKKKKAEDSDDDCDSVDDKDIWMTKSVKQINHNLYLCIKLRVLTVVLIPLTNILTQLSIICKKKRTVNRNKN